MNEIYSKIMHLKKVIRNCNELLDDMLFYEDEDAYELEIHIAKLEAELAELEYKWSKSPDNFVGSF